MESGMICSEFEGIFLNAETLPKEDEEIPEEKKAGCQKTHDEIATTFATLIDQPIKIIPRIQRASKVDPPLYHRLDFQKLSKEHKVKVLSEYYTRLSASRAKFARQSFVHASFSELIYPAVTKQDSASRSPTPEENQKCPETTYRVYTSRAGRQVKRKNYTEDFDMDSETEFVSQVVKKTKAPSSSNKLSNPLSNSSSSMKLTMGTAYEEEEDSPTKNVTVRKSSAFSKKLASAEDDIQTYEEDHKDEPKTKASSVYKSTPIPKKTFSLASNRLTRSEQMFENLKRNSAKKELEEQKLTDFENSLKSVNDADIIIESSPPMVVEEFVKRRVQPPAGIARKPRGRKKLNFQPLSMATTSTSTAATTPPSPGSATTRINSDQKRKTCESKAPTEVCPICSCKFLRPEIEEHAARCGLGDEGEVVRMRMTNLPTGVKSCPHCQMVMLLAEFEAHKMHCLAIEFANM